MSEYIFDAPPPPPSPASSIQNRSLRARGRGRGRGRGASRSIDAESLVHSNHSYDSHANWLSNLNSTKSFITATTATSTDVDNNNGDQFDMQNRRSKVAYESPYARSPTAVLYNEAGYAISQAYDPKKQPDLHTITMQDSSTTKISKNILPPPVIEGTNIKLQTEEEIAAWIAERKKRWPSSKVVEEKKLKNNNSVALLPTDTTGVVRGSRKRRVEDASGTHSTSLDRRKTICGIGCDDEVLDAQEKQASLLNTLDDPEQNLKMMENQLVRSTDRGSDVNNETDEDSDSSPEIISSKPAQPPSDEQPLINSPDQAQKNLQTAVSSKVGTRLCRYFQRGHCSREDGCTYRHELSSKNMNPKSKTINNNGNDNYKWRKRPTLIQRLIDKELEVESQSVRECFQFLVKEGLCEP